MFSSKGRCNVMNNSFKVLLKLDKTKMCNSFRRLMQSSEGFVYMKSYFKLPATYSIFSITSCFIKELTKLCYL